MGTKEEQDWARKEAERQRQLKKIQFAMNRGKFERAEEVARQEAQPEEQEIEIVRKKENRTLPEIIIPKADAEQAKKEPQVPLRRLERAVERNEEKKAAAKPPPVPKKPFNAKAFLKKYRWIIIALIAVIILSIIAYFALEYLKAPVQYVVEYK